MVSFGKKPLAADENRSNLNGLKSVSD